MVKKYIDELTQLVLHFKKRHEREESDCRMTERICTLYENGKDKRRLRILRWALKMLASDAVSSIAKRKLIAFLNQARDVLSEKQQAKLQTRIELLNQGGNASGKRKVKHK